MDIQYHTKPGGWFYLSVYGFRPFKFLQHGGWACLNAKWFWRFLVVVPRSRGWRWG